MEFTPSVTAQSISPGYRLSTRPPPLYPHQHSSSFTRLSPSTSTSVPSLAAQISSLFSVPLVLSFPSALARSNVLVSVWRSVLSTQSQESQSRLMSLVILFVSSHSSVNHSHFLVLMERRSTSQHISSVSKTSAVSRVPCGITVTSSRFPTPQLVVWLCSDDQMAY